MQPYLHGSIRSCARKPRGLAFQLLSEHFPHRGQLFAVPTPRRMELHLRIHQEWRVSALTKLLLSSCTVELCCLDCTVTTDVESLANHGIWWPLPGRSLRSASLALETLSDLARHHKPSPKIKQPQTLYSGIKGRTVESKLPQHSEARRGKLSQAGDRGPSAQRNTLQLVNASRQAAATELMHLCRSRIHCS